MPAFDKDGYRKERLCYGPLILFKWNFFEFMIVSEDCNQPLVSVIVPNYNYARYLRERIDSILNQTFVNFELILLDDASTDDSVQVMESYKNNGKVSYVILNEKNSGSPFKQWMKGICLSRGKYIWIAEADDLAKPDFLRICVDLSEKYPEMSVCFVGSTLIDINGRRISKDVNHWGKRNKRLFSYYEGQEYVIHNLYWKNYIINASGVLFRREFALNLSKSSFLQMRYCGDWQFWIEMAMQGGVIEVYQCLNYFRQHPFKVTKKSHNRGEGIAEDIRIVGFMERRLPYFSTYKKRLRRGWIYKKIKRQNIEMGCRMRLYNMMKIELNATISDYYLERRNKYLRFFLPSLLTLKRDRLK